MHTRGRGYNTGEDYYGLGYTPASESPRLSATTRACGGLTLALMDPVMDQLSDETGTVEAPMTPAPGTFTGTHWLPPIEDTISFA